MNVRDVMSRNVACCGSDTPLQDVAAMMVDCDCGEIPVADGRGRVIGVITDRDIVIRSIAQGKDPMRLTAADCMSSPAVTVQPHMPIKECCDLLESNQIRRVPVVDAGGLCVGIVALADIARHASAGATAEVVQEVSKPTLTAS